MYVCTINYIFIHTHTHTLFNWWQNYSALSLSLFKFKQTIPFLPPTSMWAALFSTVHGSDHRLKIYYLVCGSLTN